MAKRLENTIRYPTSLIVRGADTLGIEIAKSLLEQGGYVIIIDNDGANSQQLLEELKDYKLFSLIDFDSVASLDEDLRRLDYVFFLQHKTSNLNERISSQEFLQSSNYLDSILDLTAKFEAKFLLTTSIKAHQINFGKEDFELNYGVSVNNSHMMYSDADIQRYAESLVDEYEHKVGIDARIIRLGVLLGREIDLEPETSLMKLLLSALKGKSLRIPGDGLETDFYIHFLDAAYGILKAQFSTNTKGKIFSLCNEEEITILSLAYKLVELDEQAREIEFNAKDNSLPPIKIYKPAPNLASIGWKPRVGLERALAQSLEFLKGETGRKSPDDSGSGDDPGSDRKGLLGKFFRSEKPQKKEAAADSTTMQGALSRLVSERKTQDQARKGSIVLANSRMRDKMKPERRKSLPEKISMVFSDMFTALKKRFYFLRNITLTDFFFIIVAVLAFLAIYVLLLSPVLSLAKNIYFAKNNLDALTSDLPGLDISSAKISNNIFKSNLSEAQSRISDLQFVFNLLSKHDDYLKIQQLMSDGLQYSDGLDDVLQALDPLARYINTYQPQVTYRFSDSNLLTVGDDSQSYETLIDDIRDNEAIFRIAIDRIEKTRTDLKADLDGSQEWIKSQFSADVLNVDGYFNRFSSLQKSFAFLPDLLGNNGAKSYLIVVQDNARYTGGGGEIAGFVSFEIDKGKIRNLTTKQSDQLDPKFQSADDQILAEINLVGTKDVNAGNVTLKDLSLITDQELFFKAISQYWQSKEGKAPDLTAGINLDVVASLLKTNPVTYNQVSFTDSNLLSNLNLLLGDKPTVSARNEVIMNVFAQSLAKELGNFRDNFQPLMSLLADAKTKSQLQLGSGEISLKNFLTAIGSNGADAKDVMGFGMNYDQGKLTFIKFPSLTVNIDIKVNKDLSTSKTVTLNAAGTDGIQNLYYCSPNGSQNFKFNNVDELLVSRTFSADKVCALLLADSDLKYGISYDTLAFENNIGTSYNYRLELESSPGIETNFSVQFSFDPSLKVVPQDADYTKQGSNFVYTDVLEGNKQFNFQIN